MRKILVFILMMSGAADLLAQEDPDVTGSMITGSIAPVGSPFFNGEAVSFEIIAGSSIGNLNFPAPGGEPFVVRITTTRIVNVSVTVAPGFVNYFSAPVITAVGGNSFTIILTQTMTIPEGEFTRFLISGLATGPDGAAVGYQANGDPGGYDNTGPGNDAPSYFGVIVGPLPVTLVDFQAIAEGNVAQLRWSTSEENNSDHFEVQHSLDAKTWVTKGTVASSGESKTLRNYIFADPEVANGNNYYRLKSVDKDGSFELSKLRTVFFDDIPELAFEVYPNPTTDRVFIKSPDWSKVRAVSVMNMKGREVYRSGDQLQAEISVGNLPYGIYTVKVTYANQKEVVKRLAIQN